MPRAKKAPKILEPKTQCGICNKGVSQDALLHSHHCAQTDLEKKKKTQFEEVPKPPPLKRHVRDPYEGEYDDEDIPEKTYEPQVLPQYKSYAELLAIRQHEMRLARHARHVAPIRSHYGF